MVGRDTKHRPGVAVAKLAHILHILAIENHPPYFRGRRRAGGLSERSPNRLEENGVRTLAGRALNEVQNNLTLLNRIVLGMNNLNLNAELRRCRLSRDYLLDLIIVVVNRQQNELEHFHQAPLERASATFFVEQLPGAAKNKELRESRDQRNLSRGFDTYLLLRISIQNKSLFTR